MPRLPARREADRVALGWAFEKRVISMKIFPVVHVQSLEQAVDQAALALSLRADGVFLIDHGVVGIHGLLGSFQAVRGAFPDAFVGLNFLSGGSGSSYGIVADALNSGKLASAPDALWVDDARGANGFEGENVRRCELVRRTPELAAVQLYGGVSFKYTSAFSEDPAEAAVEMAAATSYVDVPTTSGSGTGTAPTPQKLAAMKAVANGKPLAVASGISIENLHRYGSSVDEILVASSVEKRCRPGAFDEKALAELVAGVHGV